MNQRFIAQENARDDEADQIRGQHGFAFGRGRQPAQEKQHEENEFHLRLTHARRAKFGDDELRQLWHEPQHHRRHHHENEQPDVEVGEKRAERQYRAQIRDEARRQNRFAERGLAKTAFDHHRVNDGDRRGGQRDAGDLRLMQRPAEHELREQPHTGKRKQKRQHANRHAGAQIGAQRNRINFRARQERQHAAAQHC